MIIKSTIKKKTKHKIHSKGERTQTGEKTAKKGNGFTLI